MLQVTGSYSFVGDDGSTYNVNYAADEKGYKPVIKITKQNKFEKMMTVMFSQMAIIAKRKSNLGYSLIG